MSSIKVSIIVPVYNVIMYLDRCVYSLVSQTYSNIEILLIDDGSIDGSDKACDKFAEGFEKVFVFHKKNGGLSDARNYAIKYATGDYITYVDSDDYVEKDMIERMVLCIENSNNKPIDMVICKHDNVNETDVKTKNNIVDNDKAMILQMNNSEALSEMCYEKKFGTTACAKLYSRRLINDTTFPVGRLYEDLASVYKLIGKANRIIYLDHVYYHYLQRQGSIRRNQWSTKVYDVLVASEELINYVEANYPQIFQDAIQRYFFSANEVYVRSFGEEKYVDIIKPVRKVLTSRWKYIKKNPKIGYKQKTRYWMMIHTPRLYRSIWLLARG